MSISYEEALSTLQAMFGPPWTQESLDTVLRHFKGHMENTVESILAHGDGQPEALLEKLKNQTTDTSMDEQLARALSQGANLGDGGGGNQQPSSTSSQPPSSTSTSSSSVGRQGRGTATNLPDDFLRVPGFTPTSTNNASSAAGGTSGSSSTTTGTPDAQMVSDEALARMLQDELFSQELARNPDYAHLARAGRGGGGAGRGSGSTGLGGLGFSIPGAPRVPQSQRQGMASAGGIFQARNQSQNQNPVDLPTMPEIMDKINELGINARRGLAQMAEQFKAKTAAARGQPASQSNGRGNEMRGLLDDDNDQMELAARKDL